MYYILYYFILYYIMKYYEISLNYYYYDSNSSSVNKYILNVKKIYLFFRQQLKSK